jgi:putative transposase
MAMKLCQQCGEARLMDMAKAFHVGHYSTVSQTIGRLNKLLLEDDRLAAEFDMLSQDLSQ